MLAAVPPQRILVIDDDDETRRTTTLLFEARGWSVETAPDLRSGIDVAHAQQPHVIVTELLLPGVQSFQFVRALRSAVDDDVHVVALTRAADDALEQARRDGFDLAVSKPLDIDDLERNVRKTTRIRRLER